MSVCSFSRSFARCRKHYARSPPLLRSSLPSYSFSYILLFLFVTVYFCIQPAEALRNVTVDDKDPRVAYTGSWERTPSFEEYSAGGGHVTTLNDPSASVTFKFQGALPTTLLIQIRFSH